MIKAPREATSSKIDERYPYGQDKVVVIEERNRRPDMEINKV